MLNVNTALYSASGIDTASVSQTTDKILKGAQSTQQNQTVVSSIDYSKFNRATLGVDLYSSRTNVSIQKQISMIQAGLYAQSVDVSQLNSAAAMNLYSAQTVQKNVELSQSIQNVELEAPTKLEEQTSEIQLFNISDKNANSSNGSNPFATSGEKDSREENQNDTLNLFV